MTRFFRIVLFPALLFPVLSAALCLSAHGQEESGGDPFALFVPPLDLSGTGTGLLLRHIEDGLSPEERLSAAWYLGLLESPGERQESVLPLFEAFLHDEDGEVRRFAGLALTRHAALLEPPNFDPARRLHFEELLVAILPPADTVLRVQAVELLARMGDTRATPALLERLYDHARPVRRAAARGVAKLGDVSALRPMRERRDSAMPGSDDYAAFDAAYQELIAQAERTTQAMKASRTKDAKGKKKAKKSVVIQTPE